MLCFVILFFFHFTVSVLIAFELSTVFFSKGNVLNYSFGDIIRFSLYFGERQHRQCTIYENTKIFKIKYINEYSKCTNVYFIKTSDTLECVCVHLVTYCTHIRSKILYAFCVLHSQNRKWKTHRVSGTTSY